MWIHVFTLLECGRATCKKLLLVNEWSYFKCAHSLGSVVVYRQCMCVCMYMYDVVFSESCRKAAYCVYTEREGMYIYFMAWENSPLANILHVRIYS